MLLIITGIALCIWGYLGTAIRPFQIYGPVCIGAGLAVYVLGCILCCREYPNYERRLAEQRKHEVVRRALDTLKDRDMISWLQGEPELHEEFRQIAKEIINDHGLVTGAGAVVDMPTARITHMNKNVHLKRVFMSSIVYQNETQNISKGADVFS